METIFLKLMNMSITASWLILAVILLRFVLKRAPKSIRRILWIVVGIRLAVPFSFKSVLSLIPSSQTVSPDIIYSETPMIKSGITVLNQAVNNVLSQSFAPVPEISINPLQLVVHRASLVWMIGAAGLLLYSIISYVKLRWRITDAVYLRDNLWQSEKVSSPFVLGLFRPRIYMPYALDHSAISPIIAHEQAHIKGHDNWIKPMGFLLLTIYWFNPLVWLAYFLLCRDIELICDERVIKRMRPEEKRVYSEALLSFSISHPSITACPLAFGEVGIRERIQNVLHYKKPAFWILVVSIIICIVLSICFLTDPKEDQKNMLTDPQETQDHTLTDPESSQDHTPLNPAADVYAFDRCVYMTPISSYIPFLDTGFLYYFENDQFRIESSKTGEAIEQVKDLDWNWTSLNKQEWANWVEKEGHIRSIPDISAFKETYVLELSSDYRLLNMDGELWLMKMADDKVWSIYALLPQAENQLTLPEVLILSQLGDQLAWEHLRPYERSDIGSGLYVFSFPIDPNWRLIVSSSSGFTYNEKITGGVRLEYLPDEEHVDIREVDAAAFVAEKESQNTQKPVVYSGASLCIMVPSEDLEALDAIHFDARHSETYMVPFSVYVDGGETPGGLYTISDIDTEEQLDFFFPSGLSSQTYILRNTEPGHKYKITFQYQKAASPPSETYAFILYR